jgi:hypothetical protein
LSKNNNNRQLGVPGWFPRMFYFIIFFIQKRMKKGQVKVVDAAEVVSEERVRSDYEDEIYFSGAGEEGQEVCYNYYSFRFFLDDEQYDKYRVADWDPSVLDIVSCWNDQLCRKMAQLQSDFRQFGYSSANNENKEECAVPKNIEVNPDWNKDWLSDDYERCVTEFYMCPEADFGKTVTQAELARMRRYIVKIGSAFRALARPFVPPFLFIKKKKQVSK